jgi:hypothetical protein
MFWKKNKGGLPGPKDLPNAVGREIVATLGGNPDIIWHYKAVWRPQEGKEDIFAVRVFDPAQPASKKIIVQDFNSLNEHPELILYEGWFDKNAGAKIEKKH